MATRKAKKAPYFTQKLYRSPRLKKRLDPELWQAILRRVRKQPQKPRISFERDQEVWLDVLVRLKDRRNVPKLLVPGLVVENPDPAAWEAIVTGSVRAQDVETLRCDDHVLSLKASKVLTPVLETFSAQSHAAVRRELADRFPDEIDGRGVIVGVVDFGCDFAHPNFRNAQGESRLLYLWDQRGEISPLSPKPFHYGRELKQADFRRALAAQDPYATLAYPVSSDSHGTPVLDIAAGNGRGTGLSGMAPNASLIFVDLGDVSGDSPLNDRRLLDAVGYIFQKADEAGLPAVVNLSLGLYAGPHDGKSLVELGLDWLLSRPGRAIVAAAGNAGNQPIHAMNVVEPQSSIEIDWRVVPNGDHDDECEIWYGGAGKLLVTLVPPGGVNAATRPVALRETFELIADGKLAGHIIHEEDDPNNGDNQIKLRVPPLGQAEAIWKIRLENSSVDSQPVPFHAWIERDDQGQSSFLQPDPSYTLGSLACGHQTLVVGAQGPQSGLAAAFSGAGPTRDGRYKPEVSAPGVEVLSARARAFATRATMRGTSAAAPHVTGIVALLFQVNRTLPIEKAREAVIGQGRRWNPKEGYGSIEVAEALKSLLPPPTVSSAALPLTTPQATVASLAGGNGQRPGDDQNGYWQVQLMQQLLAGVAAGKVRITFEIVPPNPS